MLGVLQGGDMSSQRKWCAKEIAQRPVSGFVLDGFHESATEPSARWSLLAEAMVSCLVVGVGFWLRMRRIVRNFLTLNLSHFASVWNLMVLEFLKKTSLHSYELCILIKAWELFYLFHWAWGLSGMNLVVWKPVIIIIGGYIIHYWLSECTLITLAYWFKPRLIHRCLIMICHRLCTVIIWISGS